MQRAAGGRGAGGALSDSRSPHGRAWRGAAGRARLLPTGSGIGMDALLRTTFIVDDLDAAIAFYRSVFDWRIAYDTILAVDRRFPPAAPDGARCRLVIFQAEDPEIGGLGFMRYLDDPIAPGPDKTRPRLGRGEAILVIRSADPDAVHARLAGTGAIVHAPPTDWTVPGPVAGQVIRLRTMSLFDPNGIYMEVNRRHPDA